MTVLNQIGLVYR